MAVGETKVTHGSGGSGQQRADPSTSTTERGISPRAARTRRAVVDALLALLDEGHLRPTAREVADRANVSLRSVYVHFDDVEALFLAAAIRHGERMEELLRDDPVIDGSFEERLELFVQRRSRGYEEYANVRRAAVLHAPFSPAISETLDIGRKRLRAHIEEAFAPELEAPGTDRGDYQRAAALVAANASSWDDMRLRQGLSVAGAGDVMRRLLRAVLGPAEDVG